jgi:hypothetical protein
MPVPKTAAPAAVPARKRRPAIPCAWAVDMPFLLQTAAHVLYDRR